MAYRSKYVGKYNGLGRMISRPMFAKPCRKAAVEIMHVAQAGSPVGNPAEDSHPGLYKKSFDVVPVVKNVPFRGKPRQRFGAAVINTAPHAWRVENGDGRVPRYAVLQRAVDTVTAAHGG